LKTAAIQRAQDKIAAGDQSREVHAPVTQIPHGCGASLKSERVTEPHQEETDRQAIERAEDEGMIVHQGASLNVHNSKHLNAITTW